MGVNIRTEDLTYIDLTGYDSFSGVNDDPNGPGALDRFEETLVGKAQIAAIQEGAAQQALGQGVENYELSNSQVRRILFSEQASQSYGGGHDVTNEQMLEDNGESWYSKLGGALTGLFASADETLSDAVHGGVDMAVDGVLNNGMTGKVADDLQDRHDQMDAQLKDMTM